MKCPFCEKEIDKVTGQYECENVLELTDTKVLVKNDEVDIVKITAFSCYECGKDLTDWLEMVKI